MTVELDIAKYHANKRQSRVKIWERAANAATRRTAKLERQERQARVEAEKREVLKNREIAAEQRRLDELQQGFSNFATGSTGSAPSVPQGAPPTFEVEWQLEGYGTTTPTQPKPKPRPRRKVAGKENEPPVDAPRLTIRIPPPSSSDLKITVPPRPRPRPRPRPSAQSKLSSIEGASSNTASTSMATDSVSLLPPSSRSESPDDSFSVSAQSSI